MSLDTGLKIPDFVDVSRSEIEGVKRDDLEIDINDPVNIIYSSGAINLKTVGIALGAGAVGDMIKVKNTSSGAVLLGQIINKNTVQVGGQ